MTYKNTFRSQLVELDDTTLEVWEGGEGPVTFAACHAYRASSSEHPGGGLTEALANIGRTFWICGRDVGRSSPEPRDDKLTMRVFADDLEKVRVALGIEAWIPTGSSTGATVALMNALNHPQGTQALVLVGTSASWRALEAPYSIYNPRNPVYQRLARLEVEDNGGDVWRRAMLAASVHNEDVVDTLMKDVTIHRRRLEAVGREIRDDKYDDTPRLSEIKVPTLVVNGRYDWQLGSLHAAFELVEGIATSQLAVLNQSGHMPYSEEPEEFEYAIRQFVDHSVLSSA